MTTTTGTRPFQVGDIVALRSGGPEMTVTGMLDDPNEIECSWFTKRRLQCEDLPRGAVFLVRPVEDFK